MQIIKSKHFQDGLKMFREGKVPPRPIKKIKWVKKFINQRDWDGFYKYNSVYCILGREGGIQDQKGITRGGKIKIGFCIPDDAFMGDCELLTDEEMRIVGLHRNSTRVLPTSLIEKEETEKEIEVESLF